MADQEHTPAQRGIPNGTPADAPPIPRSVQAQVVVRSAWIQSSLNYQGMQNLGRLFCLVPVARWLKLEKSEWPGFVRRHLGLFNSNPFISPLGLGALARLEADHKRGAQPLAGSMIERFSERLSTPLGAVGDELFWAAVRPQMVLLGCLVALTAGMWGPITLVVGFTAWQALYRWKTFTWGWVSGSQVASVLRDRRLRLPAQRAGLVAAACAGSLGVLLFLRHQGQIAGGHSWWSGAAFLVAAVSAGIWVHAQRPPTWALIGGLGWGLLASVGEHLFAR